MLTRKGLSDIVTNVLIILLVLVAVGIIWAFVRPVISQGAGNLQGSSDCFTIDIKPTLCESGAVTVYRGVGSGDLKGIKLIATDATGAVFTEDHSSAGEIPGELGSVLISANDVAAAQGRVQVAALVAGPTGLKSCQASTESVACN